jgi:Protein of unknown function (DUF3617)
VIEKGEAMTQGLRTTLFSMAATAGLLASPGLCAVLEIEPGLWESSETSDVDGTPGKPELSTDCVTPQDARDPVKALSGMQKDTGGKCKMSDVKQNGNIVSFVMKCGDPKEGSIDMTATFTFENSRHYSGALTSVMAIGDQKMTSKMTVDAKWIGACKK